jgi:hypothetical protein
MRRFFVAGTTPAGRHATGAERLARGAGKRSIVWILMAGADDTVNSAVLSAGPDGVGR